DSGTYRIHLAKSPGAFVVSDGDEGGVLTNGATQTGTIHVGDLDMWSFDASKVDGIVVRIGEVVDDNRHFDPWIRLYAPDGRLLDSQAGYGAAEIAVTATNTGTFTVVVADGDLCCNGSIADTGTYRIHLAKSPGA